MLPEMEGSTGAYLKYKVPLVLVAHANFKKEHVIGK